MYHGVKMTKQVMKQTGCIYMDIFIKRCLKTCVTALLIVVITWEWDVNLF